MLPRPCVRRVDCLLLLILLVACPYATAQPASVRIVDGVKQKVSWEGMVDKVVSIDGVPWGGASQGLGQYVSSPTQKVLIDTIGRDPLGLDGRLMRVTGILRRQRRDVRPTEGDRPGGGYYIDAFAVEPIEKVERDQMLAAPEDWIYVGMAGDEALKLVEERNLPEVGLALQAADPRTKLLPYSVGERLALLLVVRDNEVGSLSLVKLGKSKLYHEWSEVRGYPLPPRVEESGAPAKGLEKQLP